LVEIVRKNQLQNHMKTLRSIASTLAIATVAITATSANLSAQAIRPVVPPVAISSGQASGMGYGNSVTAADAMATTALNAQKAAINRRYGNTVRWQPVVTTRVLRYDWLGRAYYYTTKTQSYSVGF
jgi:hypothetical protein